MLVEYTERMEAKLMNTETFSGGEWGVVLCGASKRVLRVGD